MVPPNRFNWVQSRPESKIAPRGMTRVHRRRVAQFDITGLQVQSAPEKDCFHEKVLHKKILSASNEHSHTSPRNSDLFKKSDGKKVDTGAIRNLVHSHVPS